MKSTSSTFEAASSVLDSPGVLSTLRYYEDHAAEYFQRTVSVDMGKLYSRFLSLLKPNARILDVGCGSGRDLRAFAERGFQAVGVDSSASLVKLAASYAGVPCHVGRVEHLAFDGEFDAVWACASLLHVPKPSLPAALARLHAALVPNGLLFASVQLGSGSEVTGDGRFFEYYSPFEFKTAVATTGFNVNASWTSEDGLSRGAEVQWLNLLAFSTEREL